MINWVFLWFFISSFELPEIKFLFSNQRQDKIGLLKSKGGYNFFLTHLSLENQIENIVRELGSVDFRDVSSASGQFPHGNNM